MQKSTYKYLASLLAGLILTVLAHAQAQDPPAFGDNVTDLVPLDGGLSILLAAGVTYGLKKIHDSKTRDQEGGKG
jgi:hypothetical protein